MTLKPSKSGTQSSHGTALTEHVGLPKDLMVLIVACLCPTGCEKSREREGSFDTNNDIGTVFGTTDTDGPHYRSISPTTSVRTSLNSQPPLVPTPSALPDFQYVTDFTVSDAPNSLWGPGTKSTQNSRLASNILLCIPFSSTESDSEEEDLVSHHSPQPPYGTHFQYGPQPYCPFDSQSP